MTRAQWATRVRRAIAVGELVVTPAEYDELRVLAAPGPGMRDALQTVFSALSASSLGSLRLVVGEPAPPSRAEILLAAEAQARMERRMGLVAAPRHRYIDDDMRRMAMEMVTQRMAVSLRTPSGILGITGV